jgi:oxygen-dependent protoporphyrinogen oxidase
LNTAVTKLTQVNGGWIVQLNQNGRENFAEHSAVIYCGTAHRLAELEIIYGEAKQKKAEQQLRPTGVFSEIRHPPVASVVLGFRRADVTHSCEGFGMLIPKIENFKILGTIFSSALFPNRAPDGHILLTTYVGGERQPELAQLPPEKLIALVCDDLRTLLGVRGEPVFSHVAFYPQAIPQYNLGYGKFKDRLTEIESQARGLFFAGHFRDGVSLADSIVSGCNIAERVAKV